MDGFIEGSAGTIMAFRLLRYHPIPFLALKAEIRLLSYFASLNDMCLLEVAVEWHKGPVSKVPTVKVI